jgi:hypothetical protein
MCETPFECSYIAMALDVDAIFCPSPFTLVTRPIPALSLGRSRGVARAYIGRIFNARTTPEVRPSYAQATPELRP